MIIDTLGLDAISTEPELTFNMSPNAHAVLFILVADAGVTKSDSMWEKLRLPFEVEQQISKQVSSVAHMLGLLESQVYPISVQKGLVGKINAESVLL